MQTFVEGVQSFVLSLGAPGLYVIGFLDSSFFSLPEINDLLLVWMVVQNKPRMPLYAASSTLGSMSGCLVLYYLGRRGGDALVRRRFRSSRVDHALGIVQRYGPWALVVPSLFPPPAPFRIFVLLAGVSGMPLWRFIVAVAVGRGTRYFGVGTLAVWYGDQAMAYVHEHAWTVVLVVVLLVAAAVGSYLYWTKAQAPAADNPYT